MKLDDAVRLDSETDSIFVQTYQVQVVVEPPGAATPANPAPVDQPDISVLPLEVPVSSPVVNVAESDTIKFHDLEESGKEVHG
ncbi:hypothetical protein GN958_ATG02906 [Phytophthora infestans]|uniref:Uncharacterized protein n=1 Tax=Phytophthora infestans TaxID=4787 RepID=A0A8S9V979_PHYIN|nr:hypothetical protein GN958_ATG02906 [Phytophthora infestans]